MMESRFKTMIILNYAEFKTESKTQIGSGGYGTVYRMYHNDSSCDLAVKCLHPNRNLNDIDREKLLKEADLVRALSHKNIITLRGIILEAHGVDNDLGSAIVLEYAKYGSLDNVWARSPKELITSVIKRKLIYDSVLGMKYLHSRKMIHGDLKASNVLLDENFIAKITDFGMAEWKTLVSKHTPSDGLHGTVTHIPPEYLMKIDKDKEASFDVYSFGIMMWEIINNQAAFKGVQSNLIINLVPKGHRPDMEKAFRFEMPDEYYSIMNTAWKSNPEERSSFEEIEKKLNQYATGHEFEKEFKRDCDKLKASLDNIGTDQGMQKPDLNNESRGSNAFIPACVMQQQPYQTNTIVPGRSTQETGLTGPLAGLAMQPSNNEILDRNPQTLNRAGAQEVQNVLSFQLPESVRGQLSPPSTNIGSGHDKMSRNLSSFPNEQDITPLQSIPHCRLEQDITPEDSLVSENLRSIGGASLYMDSRPTKGSHARAKTQVNEKELHFPQGQREPGVTHAGRGTKIIADNGMMVITKKDGPSVTEIKLNHADGIQIGDNNTMIINRSTSQGEVRKQKEQRIQTQINQFKIPKNQRMVEPAHNVMVARHLGAKTRQLGRLLAFSDGELDSFQVDHQAEGLQEQNYQMLRAWAEKYSDKATVAKLCEGLVIIGKYDIAVKLSNL